LKNNILSSTRKRVANRPAAIQDWVGTGLVLGWYWGDIGSSLSQVLMAFLKL